MTLPLLLVSLLAAPPQPTGSMSPTSDVSGNRVKASGSTTPRALKDRAADVVNVKDIGAQGDGVTDDSSAVQLAVSTVPVGGTVILPPGVYAIKSGPVIQKALTLRGSNATLKFVTGMAMSPENNWVRVQSALGTAQTAGSGALTAGQRAFTLDAAPSGLAAGAVVYMMLGTDPYDATQPITRMFNIVESVAGSVVTVRTPIPEAVAGGGALSHRFFVPTSVAENVRIEGLSLDFAQGVGLVPDQGIIVQFARNVVVANLKGVTTTGALVEVRDSENVVVDGLYCQRADRNVHSASGRCVGGWGSRNVTFRNVTSQDADGMTVFLESQMRQVVLDGVNINAGSGTASTTNAMHVVGGSKGVIVRNLHVSSAVSRPVLNIDQGAEVVTEDVYLWRGVKAFPLHQHRGRLFFAGTQYDTRRTFRRTVRLSPNLDGSNAAWVNLPVGILASMRVFTSSTTGFTGAWLKNAIGQGSNLINNPLTSGGTTSIYFSVGDDYPANDGSAQHIEVTTDATPASGAYVTFEVEYFPPYLAADNADWFAEEHGYRRATAVELGVTGSSVGLAGSCTLTTGTSAPAAGNWKACDVIFNSSPSAGGAPGWVCTAGGTPGTWKAMANLAP